MDEDPLVCEVLVIDRCSLSRGVGNVWKLRDAVKTRCDLCPERNELHLGNLTTRRYMREIRAVGASIRDASHPRPYPLLSSMSYMDFMAP